MLAGALPAAVCGWLGLPWLALVFLALAAFMLYFFRDPERTTPDDPRAVISPADGRVMIAGPADPQAAPDGAWQQVSIFLSPLDVHINRIPVSGRVTRVQYKPGRFLAAYKWASATQNERNDIWIDRGSNSLSGLGTVSLTFT